MAAWAEDTQTAERVLTAAATAVADSMLVVGEEAAFIAVGVPAMNELADALAAAWTVELEAAQRQASNGHAWARLR